MSKNNSEAQTILIVDDEPYIRALLVEVLEDFADKGVWILTAENGVKGLELALACHPALILLDVQMPKMNGYDVCETIKKKHNLAHIYVTLLTNKGQEVDREKGREVGADEYLTKPFDPDEIVDKVSEILGIEL